MTIDVSIMFTDCTSNWWNILFVVLGFLYSVIVGHLITSRTINEVHKSMGRQPPIPWLAGTVGIVERALFTASWLIGAKGFIPVWIALKAAGEWKWQIRGNQEDSESNYARDPSRWAFNVLLIGTALSLSFGVTGAMLIHWLVESNYLCGIGVPLALVLSCWILQRWMRWKSSKQLDHIQAK